MLTARLFILTKFREYQGNIVTLFLTPPTLDLDMFTVIIVTKLVMIAVIKVTCQSTLTSGDAIMIVKQSFL
jgi:hypothetical protein